MDPISLDEKVIPVNYQFYDGDEVVDQVIRSLCLLQLAEYNNAHHLCFICCAKTNQSMVLIRDISLVDLEISQSNLSLKLPDIERLYIRNRPQGFVFSVPQQIKEDEYFINWEEAAKHPQLVRSIGNAKTPKDDPFLSAFVVCQWNKRNGNHQQGITEPYPDFIDRVCGFSAFPETFAHQYKWVITLLQGKKRLIFGE